VDREPVEWRRFDYDDKTTTAPPGHALVWIVEEFYWQGVGIGYFDGNKMRMWNGSDDCYVSWWAPMERPEPPAEWKPFADRDEED
jgi:hypothetical protein